MLSSIFVSIFVLRLLHCFSAVHEFLTGCVVVRLFAEPCVNNYVNCMKGSSGALAACGSACSAERNMVTGKQRCCNAISWLLLPEMQHKLPYPATLRVDTLSCLALEMWSSCHQMPLL